MKRRFQLLLMRLWFKKVPSEVVIAQDIHPLYFEDNWRPFPFKDGEIRSEW